MSADVATGAAFVHRDFRLYVASSFIENAAIQMVGVAIGWQVYALTHRALDLGYVGLVQLVPGVALALPAGHVADRFNRARVFAASNASLAVCAALLFAITSHGIANVVTIYTVLFFVGVSRTFAGPAGQALVPGLVPVEHFPNAAAWSSTAWQLATIVGPSLGGLLYGAAGGAQFVYGWSAALFGASSILALGIRARPSQGDPQSATLGTVLAGFRYVRGSPVILDSLSLDLFAVLLGGATALLPVYASDVLHVGPSGLGLLRSAPAIGAAATAVGLAYRPIDRKAGPIMLGCVALFGLATIVFGFSHSFALSLASLLVLGAADMVSVVVRTTVVQLRTPEDMRGRVSAVNMLFIVGSNELGQLESGVTAAWLGAVSAVVLGGVGTVVVVVLYALLSHLPGIDRLDEEEMSRGERKTAS
jgi:MFS family permease